MTNLTLEQQVIKIPTGLVQPDGYWLVIYEKVEGGGPKFSKLQEPGQSAEARKSLFTWFRNQPDCFAIAVVEAKQNYHFSEPVLMEDSQLHEFDLLFDLTYKVGDPQKVAELREQDPLRRLRDEIARVIGRSFKRQAWVHIKQSFPDLEKAIWGNDKKALELYAREMGLQIITLALSKRLPEKELTADLAAAEAELARHKVTLEQESQRHKLGEVYLTRSAQREYDDTLAEKTKAREHEQRKQAAAREAVLREQQLEARLHLLEKESILHGADQNRILIEARTEAAKQAMLNVGRNIETSAELLNAFRDVREIGEAHHPSGPATNSFAVLPGQNAKQLTTGTEDRRGSLLDQALREINQWNYSFAQKCALSSAVLHIVAELWLNDAADKTKLDGYVENLNEVCQSLRPQPTGASYEFLKLFLQPEQLRERFK